MNIEFELETNRLDSRIATRAWTFLIVGAIGIGAFYYALFQRANALARVDLVSYSKNMDGFAAGVDRCIWTARKIAVSGFVARRGTSASRRRVRIVVADRQHRHGYELATTLRDSEDISRSLNRRFGDGIRYRNVGFDASVSIIAARLMFRDPVLFLTYEEPDLRSILPLACGPNMEE